MIKSILTLSFVVILLSTAAIKVNASPCGWHLDLEPFYLKATDDLLTNAMFAVKIADPLILGDNRELYLPNIQGAFGARIGIGYDFPSCTNSNRGLSLEYTFYNHENTTVVFNDSRNNAGLPVIGSAEFIDITDESGARFSLAKNSLSQNYDTVDLLAEKNICLPRCSFIKIFAGARYFHLDEHLNDHYEFIGPIPPVGGVTVTNIYNVHFKNRVDSVGPEIGGKVFYNFANGLGITGQIAGSLLCGESKSQFNNDYHLSPASALGDPRILTSASSYDDVAHVIPALSGKVALAYRGNFCRCGSFTVEAGYRGDKYFHAANDVAYQHLLAGDDINSNSNYQDFSLSGPYLCLTLHA